MLLRTPYATPSRLGPHGALCLDPGDERCPSLDRALLSAPPCNAVRSPYATLLRLGSRGTLRLDLDSLPSLTTFLSGPGLDGDGHALLLNLH